MKPETRVEDIVIILADLMFDLVGSVCRSPKEETLIINATNEIEKLLDEKDREIQKWEKFGKELTETTGYFTTPKDYIKLYEAKDRENARLRKLMGEKDSEIEELKRMQIILTNSFMGNGNADELAEIARLRKLIKDAKEG